MHMSVKREAWHATQPLRCLCFLPITCSSGQGVEDGAEIEFQMELLSYTKHAAWVAMTPDEKLTRAEALKEQGNATLKAGQLKHARTKYLKAIRILDQTFDFQGDDQVSRVLSSHSCNSYVYITCISMNIGGFL